MIGRERLGLDKEKAVERLRVGNPIGNEMNKQRKTMGGEVVDCANRN
jgi:hypothetical protein